MQYDSEKMRGSRVGKSLTRIKQRISDPVSMLEHVTQMLASAALDSDLSACGTCFYRTGHGNTFVNNKNDTLTSLQDRVNMHVKY